MTASPNGALLTHEDGVFDFFAATARDLGVSGGTETEKKYLHGVDGDSLRLYEAQLQHVRANLNAERPTVRAFEGLDYYFLLSAGGKELILRHRTGKPTRCRACLKSETDVEHHREELELDLDPETRDEDALAFWRRLISFTGVSCREMRIAVKGEIFFVPFPKAGMNSKVEVVVYTGKNPDNNREVCVSEVEVHHVSDHAIVMERILHYEARLGWEGRFTPLTMCQLLG